MNEQIEFFEIIPWNSNFETGIALIDGQHKKLVEILNNLAAHLADLSEDMILNEVFDELADYADYHFKSEEGFWSTHFEGDEWYQEHQKTHTAFMNEVINIKNNQDQKELNEVIFDIVSFLTDWLVSHILDTDKRMAIAYMALESGSTMEQAKEYADEEMSGSLKALISTVLSMYGNLSSRTMDLMREKTLRKQAQDALKLSEERWNFILNNHTDDLWDWNIEKDKFNHINDSVAIENIADIVLKANEKIATIHPDDIDSVKADFLAHLNGETELYINKHRVLYSNGSWSWVLSRGKVIRRSKDGDPLCIVGSHTDITEQELASMIFQNSSQGMLVSDARNKIISVNPAFTKITGYMPDEVIGKDPNILAAKKYDDNFHQQMWDSISKQGYWKGELWNKRKDGESYPEELMINAVRDKNGKIDHFIALFSDISEKKKADDIIAQHANYDALTHLLNRRMFVTRLEQEIQRSNRNNLPFGLLFIDLDHFKNVNDTLGHEAGDALLIQAAKRILAQVREIDIVARYGGDEFTVLLTNISQTVHIDRIAQNIINALNQPFELKSNQAQISASIGVSLFPSDANTVDELLTYADQAMYQAKRSGRGQYNYFTPAMQLLAQKRQHLLEDLHSAMDMDELELYYQPIVDLKSGTISKAEALVRWNHPDGRLIHPNEFIPIAEQSGLIGDIGDWVFNESSRQADLWSREYGIEFQISINLSPVELNSQTKLEHWEKHLSAPNSTTTNSIIEITESLLVEGEDAIIEVLDRCREAGISISLDNFGTGDSSLSYLKKYEIDYIKIDREFISALEPDSRSLALCRAMIVMAHMLDIEVIAEGIETPMQRQLLLESGCDFGQGYLFSRPLPTDGFEEFLKSSSTTDTRS